MAKRDKGRKNKRASVSKKPAKNKRVGTFSGKSEKWLGMTKPALLAIAIILSFVSYIPSLDNEFTNWDDDKYVTENTIVKNWDDQTFKRIISEPVSSNYHPLTVLTFALQYQVAGNNPFTYILFNLLVHLLNIALVFYLVYLLAGRKTGVAFMTALLFGIHPMHVESVAWISERKDVLYTAFFLGSMIMYIRYLKTNLNKPYIWTLLFSVLSLMSKPAAVVLPLNLILLHYFFDKPLKRKNIIGLIPFFIGSLFLGLITISFQSETAIQSSMAEGLGHKILFASYGFVMYIVKLIVPFNLNHFYPYPSDQEGLSLTYYLAPLLVILACLFVWIKRKNKILVFGWLFYIINIILVLQVLQVGWAVMAERYTYVPYIGLLFIIAHYFQVLLDTKTAKTMKYAGLGILGAVCLVFVYLSFQRSDVWQNSKTLWTDNNSKTPNSVACNNLGNYYVGLNQPDTSVSYYLKALEMDPGHSKAHKNLAVVYIFQKKFDEAIHHLNTAIQLSPDYTSAYLHLGKAYINKQQYQQALGPLNHYLERTPTDAYAYNARAMCYHLGGNIRQSIPDYERAIQLSPNSGLYYFNRAQAHESLGNRQAALIDALKARSLGHKVDDGFIQRLQ